MKISVVIPAYNEENVIEKTILEINDYLKNKYYDFEIIVVNDGSIDSTVKIVSKLCSQISNLSLIDNSENRGKGYAVRQGLLKAKGTYRLFTDADNSTPIDSIEKLFPYLKENYDIIIGSRAIEGAKITVFQPPIRRTLSIIYRYLSKVIVGLQDFKDTQCGFKLFTKKSVENIFPYCISNSWSFDLEILMAAKKLGYKIKEVPVSWHNNKDTKVKLSHSFGILTDLIKIRRNLHNNFTRKN